MRLEQLEYIITINECRSINKAAKKLFISPQTLYSSLAALEEELGFPIFLRNTKGVAITYLGQQIINDAQNMIKTLKKWQEISENPQSVSNEIRIAAGGVFNSLLVEIIARLHETYPKATINLKHINAPSFFQNNSQEILDDDIIMASIDCSLADQIYTIIQHKGYCTMELGLDTLSLFISASHT